jgi:hypothetical protein
MTVVINITIFHFNTVSIANALVGSDRIWGLSTSLPSLKLIYSLAPIGSFLPTSCSDCYGAGYDILFFLKTAVGLSTSGCR